MLDIAKQRRFVQIAVDSSPRRSARSIATEAGFAPAYASRLMRRHGPEIEKRRAKLARFGNTRPVSKGEQLRLWERGESLGLVDPDRAFARWYELRANLHDMELGRWGEPLSELKAQRRLQQERKRFDRLTEHTVECYRLHGRKIPGDLLEKDLLARGRTATPTATVDGAELDVETSRAPATAGQEERHPLAPRRCPSCLSLLLPEPQYGFIGDGRGIGIVGTKLTCNCHADGTTYATPRSRELAMSWTFPQQRTLASTGPGARPSPYASSFYARDFDPFTDF